MNSSSDFLAMVQYDSNKLDFQLIGLLPEVLVQLYFPESSPQILTESIPTQSMIEEESNFELSQSQPSFHSEEETKPKSETPQQRPPGKINFKTNIQHFRKSSQDLSDSESPVRRVIHRRRKRGETNGYPTKNFLPNFKGPHFQFLQSQLGASVVYRLEAVRAIKKKNGISMKDYEFLYRIQQFSQAFQKFFRLKVLYRELMLSRSSVKARKVHIGKITVFEEAYRSKNFERIN